MSEVGQLLKKARLEKNLSLDDIQEATKIRKRYLEAIEADDYKVLPGSFYVRAFVKTYAEMVGINPDEILQNYRNVATESESHNDPIIRENRLVQHSERFGRWATTLLMWSFVILIMVILYFSLVKSSGSPHNQVTDNMKITESKLPPPLTNQVHTGNDGVGNQDHLRSEPVAIQPRKSEDKPIILPQKSSRAMDHFVVAQPDNGKIEVEIIATGGYSWLGVHVGNHSGKRLYYENLHDGTSVKFEVPTEGLAIRSGRADLITIKVAGETLPDGDVADSKNIHVQMIPYERARQLRQKDR